MITVSKSLGATVANGALSFWFQGADGALADVESISVQIVKPDGTDALAKTALNMANAPAGTRVGIGHHAYAWAPGANAAGLYTVIWYYVAAVGDAEQSFALPFELVAVPYPFGPRYCTVQSLRDEGLSSTTTEAQAQSAIVRASRYVEHFTGRTFEAARKSVRANGTSGRALLLKEAIVAIEAIQIADPLGGLALVDDTLRVYNRHLTENLLDPDDRENPRLEFIHGNDLGGANESCGFGGWNSSRVSGQLGDLIWPRGRQNVHVTGLFGYTEPDGSFIGGTPALIQEATRLLVFRNLAKIPVRSQTVAGPIVQETTKDQTVMYQQLKDERFSGFTADFEIDMLLLPFVRPPNFGAA